MDHTTQNNQHIEFETRLDLQPLKQSMEQIRQELRKVIIGQEHVMDQILVCLLASGHILLEGAPGVAKTLMAKLLAQSTDIHFKRIQFTPDLMPSDILGVSIYNQESNSFEFKKGPLFSNMVLIDEINRAPAKTQSALFEAMEEKQITIDSHSYPLKGPFIVIATQNPIEQEGTYPLPEAQLDRFLFKINIDYPSLENEIELLEREQSFTTTNKLSLVEPVLHSKDLLHYQDLIKKVHIDKHLIEYIAKIVSDTRDNPLLYLGASPRASIAILQTSKAYAAMQGRDFVTPEDIKMVIFPVLTHRVVLNPDKEMEGLTSKEVITMIMDTVEIPR